MLSPTISFFICMIHLINFKVLMLCFSFIVIKKGMGDDEIDSLFPFRLNHSQNSDISPVIDYLNYISLLLTFDRLHHSISKVLLHKEEDKSSWQSCNYVRCQNHS